MAFGIEALGSSSVGNSTTEGLMNVTKECIIKYNVLNAVSENNFKNRWRILNNIVKEYINNYHILSNINSEFINSYIILNETVNKQLVINYNIYNNVTYSFISRSVITEPINPYSFNINYFIYSSVGNKPVTINWELRNDITIFFDIDWELESNTTITTAPYEYVYPVLDRTFYLK